MSNYGYVLKFQLVKILFTRQNKIVYVFHLISKEVKFLTSMSILRVKNEQNHSFLPYFNGFIYA